MDELRKANQALVDAARKKYPKATSVTVHRHTCWKPGNSLLDLPTEVWTALPTMQTIIEKGKDSEILSKLARPIDEE